MGVWKKKGKKGLDDTQRKISEKYKKVVEKAFNNLILKGNVPSYPDMEKEVEHIRTEEGFQKPISKPSIYKYWNPLREKHEKIINESKPTKIYNPVRFYVLNEKTDLETKKQKEELDNRRNANPLKKGISIISGDFSRRNKLLARRLRKTRERDLRKQRWLEHLINIEIEPELQGYYVLQEKYQELTELVTEMFSSYFFKLRNYTEPEKSKSMTLTINFDPFNGTITFLKDEIQNLEESLLTKTIPEGFCKMFESLQTVHKEHYRLMAIKNKKFNQEDFERFKRGIRKFTIKQLMKKRNDVFFTPPKWMEKLEQFLNGYIPQKYQILDMTNGNVNRDILSDYYIYHGIDYSERENFLHELKKELKP